MPRASLGGLVVRRFRWFVALLRDLLILFMIDVFGEKTFCFLGKLFCFSVFSRCCKFILKKLGSGWCRGALRGVPRTLRDVDENDKRGQKMPNMFLAPQGGQAKSVKRSLSVGERIRSCYKGIIDKKL